MPITLAARITTEMIISYGGTVLIAILVNIAIGEVNGMKEQIFRRTLSTSPLLIENITTMNAATNSRVSGMVYILHFCSR